MLQKALKCSLIAGFVGLCLVLSFFAIECAIKGIPDVLILTREDIVELSNGSQSSLFKVEYKECSQSSASAGGCFKEGQLATKLFGVVPIKTIKIKVVQEDEILASGKVVGISLQNKGVVIIGANPLLTHNGKQLVSLESKLAVGDIISEIEGEVIDCAARVEEILNKDEYKGKELVVKGKRNSDTFYTTIKPALDLQTQKYKLGFWVRDDASGLGTVTYVEPKNRRFGALGHPISDIDTGTALEVFDGNIYNCNVMSVAKGTRGRTGEIKGLFLQNSHALGNVDINNKFGIYGYATEDSSLLNYGKIVGIGGRKTVKPGAATILSCLDGKNVEEFEIEIVKTNYQSNSQNKSMLIKVKDKELISRTGGIVQGMSGSPIIQNGKLVGAITHVFVNDPTKGFAVYLDWMIDN